LAAASTAFFGVTLLTIVFLLCSFAVVFGVVALRLNPAGPQKAYRWARFAQLVAGCLAAVALIVLVVAFLRDDFSLRVVAGYSSVELPVFYKLSALWAGAEGSLLLWTVCVFLLFGLWLSRLSPTNFGINAWGLTLGATVCLGFTAILLFAAQPFVRSLVTVDDGRGLNPLLQSFWNVVHPPLLFIGYSALLIPWIIGSSALFAGEICNPWVYAQARRWLLVGLCFLSLGIVTGARWSYIELGWGGYWAWDPVENASLLPWLAAVAALHSLAGMKLSERFHFWTVVLLPLPFTLCLLATFVTRSGILQSVHSFGGSIMPWTLLGFVGFGFLIWFVSVFRAVRSVVVLPPQLGTPIMDKVGLLSWSNLIFILLAIVIGTATFWPALQRLWTGSDSGFMVRRGFYDNIISGAGVILAFLLGLSTLAGLQNRKGFRLYTFLCIGVGLICYGLVFQVLETTFFIAFACGICAFGFVGIVISLYVGLKDNGRIQGQVAHLGLLLLVVSAGFAAKERVAQTQLAKGTRMRVGQYSFVYDSFEHKLSDKIAKVGPNIVVSKSGFEKTLWPHKKLYSGGYNSNEVAVCTRLLEDVYVAFDGVESDGSVVITAKVKPFMLWLWAACGLIIAGLALPIFTRQKVDSET